MSLRVKYEDKVALRTKKISTVIDPLNTGCKIILENDGMRYCIMF